MFHNLTENAFVSIFVFVLNENIFVSTPYLLLFKAKLLQVGNFETFKFDRVADSFSPILASLAFTQIENKYKQIKKTNANTKFDSVADTFPPILVNFVFTDQ